MMIEGRSYPSPDYVDWAGYSDAVYTPAPELVALPDYEGFWRTCGGNDWGFGEEIDRERALARDLL